MEVQILPNEYASVMHLLCLLFHYYYYYASIFDAGLLVDSPLLAVVAGASYCMYSLL